MVAGNIEMFRIQGNSTNPDPPHWLPGREECLGDANQKVPQGIPNL